MTHVPVIFGRARGLAGVLIALLPCTACAAAEEAKPKTVPAKDLTKTLQHDGIERTYHVHLPPGFAKDKPSPLVIALHGGGGRGKRFDVSATAGTLSAAADRKGVVLVFPDGVNRHWCDGRREILKDGKPHDDVGFISALIDAMQADYGVDPQRVYATGISNGGFMSIRLAMDLSHEIAAVAPVTAQISKALAGKTPKRPIAIMIVNGTGDPLVPYAGGHIRLFWFGRSRGEILSTDATVERFRRHNGCGATPKTARLPDRDPKDDARAEVARYTGGKDGTEVVLVKVVGGGHTWPGGNQYIGRKLVGTVCMDFNASEMILEFFLRHSRKRPSTR